MAGSRVELAIAIRAQLGDAIRNLDRLEKEISGVGAQSTRGPAARRPVAAAEHAAGPRAVGGGIAAVRSGVERVFAVYKRCYGLGRTRFLGLAKHTTFYGLAAIAPDIRKGAMLLRLDGLARPASEG